MATRPVDDLRITERFGPHLAVMAGERLSTTVEPERLVRPRIAIALFALNVIFYVGYVGLWGLTVARILRRRAQVVAEMDEIGGERGQASASHL